MVLSLSLFSARKKSGEELTCDLEHSRPTSIAWTDVNGKVVVQEVSYDAQNRITKITNNDGVNTLNISYPSSDSIVFEQGEGSMGYSNSVRVFNQQGDYLSYSSKIYNSTGVVVTVVEFTYEYDTLRQRVKSIGINKHFTNGVLSKTNTVDSTFYTWKDGNLISYEGYEGIYYNSFIRGTYTYLDGTNGHFIYNSPVFLLPINYVTLGSPLHSKNLVASKKEGPMESVFKYDIDKEGRVLKWTISTTGSIYSYLFVNGTQTYEFRYKCI